MGRLGVEDSVSFLRSIPVYTFPSRTRRQTSVSQTLICSFQQHSSSMQAFVTYGAPASAVPYVHEVSPVRRRTWTEIGTDTCKRPLQTQKPVQAIFNSGFPPRPTDWRRSKPERESSPAEGSLSDAEEPTANDAREFPQKTASEEAWAKIVDTVSISEPLSDDEREKLMTKLPDPIARFLIRRAEYGLSGDLKTKTTEEERGTLTSFMRENPPLRVDETRENNIKDIMFDKPAPAFEDLYFNRRTSDRPSRKFEDAKEEEEYLRELYWNYDDYVTKSKKRKKATFSPLESEAFSDAIAPQSEPSPFVGSPSDPGEQAQQLAYGFLVLVLALIALKVVLAFVQFFVSFSFSFFAIFALSAGIFVFFFILRF